jgi:predicted RNase H-like HicB family nuclease
MEFMHIITDARTGEVTEVPFTQAEIDALAETPEQTIKRLESAIDTHLDAVAQSYRYESIRTMVSYENDPNPKFHNEGQAAKRFRSACYTTAIDTLEAVTTGLMLPPTEKELVALMPSITDFLLSE